MFTSTNCFLTRGQAACLVLDMVPSVENRRKATDMMDSTALDITYTEDQGPKHPFAMGKSIIAKNPFTYKTYPRTPPASPILHPKMPPVIPTLSPATLPSNPSASVVPSGEEVSGSSNSYGFSNSDDAAYTPENILCVVKSLYFKRVENEELFDYGVYSTTDIYYHVARQFLPRLPDFMYVNTFGKHVLNKAGFGKKVTKKFVGKKTTCGRMLYKLKNHQ